MASTPIDINPILDRIMRLSGLSQKQVAEELGYAEMYLSQSRTSGTKKLKKRLEEFEEKIRKSKPQSESGETQIIYSDVLRENEFLHKQLEEKERIIESKEATIKALQVTIATMEKQLAYMGSQQEKTTNANLKGAAKSKRSA